MSRTFASFEQLAAQLRDAVTRLAERARAGKLDPAEIRALVVAFESLRSEPRGGATERVRAAVDQVCALMLAEPRSASEVAALRSWLAAVELVAADAGDSGDAPERARDLLVLPAALPDRAALSRLAGEYATILIHGGAGAVDEAGAPGMFNGTPRSEALARWFADLRAARITGRCVVADFDHSLAWLAELLPLLAPGGFAVAAWTAAAGAPARAVLAGARTPVEVLGRATAELAATHRGWFFDSPYALYAARDGRLLRGDDPLAWVLLAPSRANADLAATLAATRWFEAHLVGEQAPVRRCDRAVGLLEFAAQVRALAG